MSNVRGAIYNLIKVLTSQELEELCSVYFISVFNNFKQGQAVNERRQELLDYVDKHQEKILELLKGIKELEHDIPDSIILKLLDYVNKHQEKNPELLKGINELLKGINKELEHDIPIPPPVPPEPDLDLKTCDILILAANPIGTDPLELQQEADLIQKEAGSNYVVKLEKAALVEDISKHLLRYEPLIVHFSAHGIPNGDIILNNAQGQTQLVSPVALANLLSVIRGRIECVVLNACFSLEKADALKEQVRCLVGMSIEIDDESAINFSAGFYRALASGEDYYTAFGIGCAQIQVMNLPDSQVPRFVSRDTSILQPERGKPRSTRTGSQKPAIATLYPLWYGTNRKPIDPQDISLGFSAERDRQIHYGTCEVAVPKSHKIGSTGSPWWQKLLTSVDDCLKLNKKSVKLFNEVDFWAGVKRELQNHELDERSALVFIHGFNFSFEDAALRAAQIGFDLQVPGIMAFYSWPSKGKLASYSADEATIEASEKYITQFLFNFAKNSGAQKIHIIAHSMGNRGLLRAMQRILYQVQATASDIQFGQVFLAAPDVDPDLFEDLAEAYRKLTERTTLYVSAKDKALATSGIIHDRPRLGFFPPITVVDRIDTVEVSNIDLTLLGHGYFADARILLEDIREVLVNNTSPEQRRGRLQAARDGNYWIVRR